MFKKKLTKRHTCENTTSSRHVNGLLFSIYAISISRTLEVKATKSLSRTPKNLSTWYQLSDIYFLL
jgi:hypothetical protein